MTNNISIANTSPENEQEPIVEVAGVQRRFGAVHALGPLDMKISPGEFVSIVGPSGCGKSTLLELVAGLQSPNEGHVAVAGAPVTGPQERTAIIFQDSATLPWRTVTDNVAFGLEARSVPRKQRRAKAENLLEMVGLSGFGDHYPPQLSGGMRQRVAIARALSLDPDLILADEPFGALDEQTRLLMSFELLKVVEAQRCGVLFITHSIQEAVLLSDRVLVMSSRPGQIIDEVPITLPRPRDEHALGRPESARAIDRIWSAVRDQAQLAMSGAPA